MAHFDAAISRLEKQGDLIHAAEALISQIEKDQAANKPAISTAAAKVKQAIKMIETEGAALPRRMHTPGADQ